MYLSMRAALVRNIAASVANGAVTLTLLLIAPLGLAAVIANTLIVTTSTFIICSVGDIVVTWLLHPAKRNDLFEQSRRREIQHFQQTRDIERR